MRSSEKSGLRSGAAGCMVAALVVAGAAARAQHAPPPAAGGRLEYIAIPAPSLAKSVYHTPTRQPAEVYLPPSYEASGRRYPVVYYLPGFGDAVQMYTDWGMYQGFSLKTAMDRLIAEGRVKEMIVVIPNGQNFLGGSFYVNSPLTGNWEDYIAQDLVARIDRRYRTLAAPASRAISGHSMGGSGALTLAMRHPDVFGLVYALSPGLAAPGGLATHVMFDSLNVAQVLDENDSLAALPEAEARVALMAWAHLQSSTYNTPPLFAYAYAAAFAPDPEGRAPYIPFVYRRSHGRTVEDPVVRRKFEAGFGDLEEKADRYAPILGKLTLVAIDVGARDEHAWIPPGCRLFAKLLAERGVPVRLLEHGGTHQDHLAERLTEHMFPMLSERLAF